MECQEALEEHSIIRLLTEANQLGDIRSTGKVSSVLDAVTSYLRSDPPAKEGVQVARMAFGSMLPHLQVDEPSLCLFDAAFSFLKFSYDSFLEGCAMKDATAMSHVADLLQHCCTVSECCELAVKFLLQAEKIAVEDLGSVPKVFLHIVTSSLTHCKQSKTIYADQLYQVKDSLSSLFHLSVEMASDFGSLLSRLAFDSLQEDDLKILTEVCDMLCTTAVCLSQLSEVRGSVTVWRAYTNLIHQYHGALVTRLDLSPPMTALVNEIKDGLQTLASLPLKESTVRVSSACHLHFIFCEYFEDYKHAKSTKEDHRNADEGRIDHSSPEKMTF